MATVEYDITWEQIEKLKHTIFSKTMDMFRYKNRISDTRMSWKEAVEEAIMLTLLELGFLPQP